MSSDADRQPRSMASTPLCSVGIALVLAGCMHAVPSQTELLKKAGGTITAADMRVRVYELGRRAGIMIESTADSIAQRSIDPAVRRNALLWKINALPAFEEAALQTDPLGAAAESYALAAQMHRFFAATTGRDAFGLDQPMAVAAMALLERDALATLTVAFPGDTLPTRTRRRFMAWLDAHPLTSLSFTRPSLAAAWPQIAAGTAGGLARTVGSMERTVEEMSDRLAFANEHAMKQLRWNMTLMAADAVTALKVDSVMGVSRHALEQVRHLTTSVPGFVSGQRDTVLAALRGERSAVLAAVTGERIAVLAGLHDERVATLASLDSMMVEAFQQSSRLIDHVFWRVAQLLAVTLLGVILAVVVGITLWNRTHGRSDWRPQASRPIF